MQSSDRQSDTCVRSRILTPIAPRPPPLQTGLNKTKDQLSIVEDRAKQLSLDLQRCQMDLLAKTSE